MRLTRIFYALTLISVLFLSCSVEELDSKTDDQTNYVEDLQATDETETPVDEGGGTSGNS